MRSASTADCAEVVFCLHIDFVSQRTNMSSLDDTWSLCSTVLTSRTMLRACMAVLLTLPKMTLSFMFTARLWTVQRKRDDWRPTRRLLHCSTNAWHQIVWNCWTLDAVYLDRFTAATCEYQSTTQIALKDYNIRTWRCVTCLGVDLSTLSWCWRLTWSRFQLIASTAASPAAVDPVSTHVDKCLHRLDSLYPLSLWPPRHISDRLDIHGAGLSRKLS